MLGTYVRTPLRLFLASRCTIQNSLQAKPTLYFALVLPTYLHHHRSPAAYMDAAGSTPSRLHGLSAEIEAVLRAKSVHFIQRITLLLKL